MAKKTAEKKPRRRLKRTARRSMAAVLMITAVVVAAIPVPENVAAPEGGIALLADAPDAYSYPKHDAKGEMLDKNNSVRVLCPGSNLQKPKDATEYNANIVTKLSDGQYQLDWQFKFFLSNLADPGSGSNSGTSRGIISEYNSTYHQDEVTLNPNVIYEYDKISYEKFEDFFNLEKTTATTKEYVLKKPDPTALEDPGMNVDKFFNDYFNAAYTAQAEAYEKYEKEHEEWKNDPDRDLTLSPDPNEPQKPADITRKITDLSDDQRLKYYCDVNRSGGTSLAGCKLARVIDSASSTGATNVRVYIPQKIEGQAPSGYFDANGLKYISDASIIGIGNEAFKGKQNVFKLNIPEEIKYIGKSAFESSFIKEVSFVNVEQICDYAFKDCESLTKIDFGKQPTTTMLGVECFFGTAVTDIQFPESIKVIGPGAFAYCESLHTLDFSKVSARPAVICEYAFYNDISLISTNFLQNPNQTVNIDTIGDGAFAVESGVVGDMTEFLFPTKISKVQKIIYTADDPDDGHGLGNCVLAGRTNLETVTMPSDFGRSTDAIVPADTFYNCYNLAKVIFPDDGNGSCGRASYDGTRETGLFRSVGNSDFLVQGPELDSAKNIATPRKTTWDAVTAVSDKVPYLYVKNGQNFYEISDGEYLMCINNTGVLTSCERKDTSVKPKDVDLEIPSEVGGTKVKGIASDCFKDKELNENVRSLTIADNSLSEIQNGVFKDWTNLKKVKIGNSVNKIGDSAFEGCNKLTDVTFNSPSGGHEAFEIGKDAFKTGSTELTFHGDIVKGYAPFEWATDKDNVIKEPDGIRVCYKSLAPTFLTVMYDENTNLVTLLDYPKLSQVSDLLNEAYETEIKDGRYGSYERMREEKSYIEFSSGTYEPRRESFKNLWMEDKEAAYNSEFYGPWITPAFCAGADSWGTVTPTPDPDEGGGSVSGNTASAIADFLFEPITVYAADRPDPYYTRNPFKVGDSDTGYPALNAEELGLLDAVQNIVVPDGVDSIDVYGYIGDRTDPNNRNANNADIYLNGPLGYDVWSMYSSRAKKDENGSTTTQPGLFSGYYDDGLGSNNGERFKRGNDRILSVTMNSVTYLPDYAFDSCENLQSVILGPKCKDIGIAPFRGCYEMTKVGDNDYYTTVNGLIYSKNEDGSLTIEECLSARGRKSEISSPIVNSVTDENIKNVSKIKPGAFEDCDSLTKVLFGSNDTAGLTEIPENCFKNCDELQEVVLPLTTNDIGRGAFAECDKLSYLTIYGDEVKISGSAFSKDKTVGTTVRAHEDSAVVRYVKEYGETYKLYYDADNPLGKQWKVSFYDANYKLIENMTDDLGNPIDNPQFVTDGEKAIIPSKPELKGWNFEDWVGLNGADYRLPIREDTVFYAQGHYDSGAPVDGKYVVEFHDGVTGEQLAGRGSNPSDGKYYVPVGESFADQGWPEPLHQNHAGYEPAGFSSGDGSAGQWTKDTVVNGNLAVIALYKASANGGGTTNTSGNTTNTSKNSGNTSNNGNTSSSSTSTTSSSTSGSSTSTTSSTSDGAGQYTVFVENGSGSGSYTPGTTVIIQASIPAAGMKFSNWTTDSNGVTLASASMAATTFTMPSNNVTVKANYVEDTGTAASTTSTGNTVDRDNGSTRVDIEKPGISNRDLATATVNGSTDNFIVKITETDEATRAVAAALTNKYGTLDNILYYAMDISLYDSTGTTKISDTTGLTVDITIPIPDSLVAYGGNNKAGAVVNSDQLESLNESFTTINGVPCIKFRATHFSPYTIYVDTGNLVEGMLDTTPKTGDPIHPKWFLSLGLACLSIILFMKKDKKVAVKAARKA